MPKTPNNKFNTIIIQKDEYYRLLKIEKLCKNFKKEIENA